jgi:CD109 antigen
MRFKSLLVTLTAAIMALPVAGCCRPVAAAESYFAVVPQILHCGATEAISLSLLRGDSLVPGRVEVALLKAGETIVREQGSIDGKGVIELAIPDIEEGEYEISVAGNGFADKASVRVEKSLLIFLESDKPIYKPGQTIHIRVVTLNSELRPVSESVAVEILDAKGIKIFRQEIDTDDYGLASLELPISSEPNLGTWKINAAAQETKTQLDVRVERYVLPKYEVKVELPKEWFLVSEPITGRVLSEYSFGKPVSGELEIRASRYVGQWEEYASFFKAISGEAEFELPPVGYVAGVPEAGGMGNVMLKITVRETATGYEEGTSRLLTVADSPVNIQIIPEGSVFKPGLPFSFLIITETPDNQLIEARVAVEVTYLDDELKDIKTDEMEVETTKGKEIIELTPPKKSVALVIEASTKGSEAAKMLEASYSPSANFIHVEQISKAVPQVGEEISFRVYSTREAANLYYEVVALDKVVFSNYTREPEIAFEATPLMAPGAKLLVYQILPNSEVAADYLPFKVEANYPHAVSVAFAEEEASPGEVVSINIETDGKAKVGLTAVDKSVFILAENRLNLQQVFSELERLFMEPQAELHEVAIYPEITTQGAKDIFESAGVVILTNNQVPEGKEYQWQGQSGIWDKMLRFFQGVMPMVEEAPMPAPPAVPASPGAADMSSGEGLVEVERVRQYFPETWLWEEIVTSAQGESSLEVIVPDTITTWILRAVALSREKGLGVAEDELKAFQPFFLKIDLPYSAIRGEEFPVRVALYNYLEESQRILVEIEDAGWFDLLDESAKVVEVAGSNIGGVEFKIRPEKLGINEIKIKARSQQAADAAIKTLIVKPEGVAREVVNNLVLSAGDERVIETFIPSVAVSDSGRAYLALTSSYLTQTMEGLEELIQMPFGCGEQNMIVFAPDVYIAKYLEESGQLKPEIMAKAEKLMITGYQRELTYRHSDGSFSAFGEGDEEGSLWLTAFVLKSFAQANDLIFIDQGILDEARDWITGHQNGDGSFDSVGFVHHQEMLGGLKGKTALTAYTAIALLEAGEKASADRVIGYLEGELDEIDDAYTMVITAYALELGQSNKSDEAYERLMEMAVEDEDGLHWGSGGDMLPTEPWEGKLSTDIETTAYATLALIKHEDAFNASRAAKWLVSRRNAYGGFGSTQDTVVSLQALTEYAIDARADVDLAVTVAGDGVHEEMRVDEQNFDILQIIELPVDEEIEISVVGMGEAIAQVVRRFNVPEAEPVDEIMTISVDYNTTEVEVNDLVTVSVELGFTPPVPMEAGMIVLDVSIPTGFEAITDSVAEAVEAEEAIKRYEIAGRKVIFYIENMLPGDHVSFSFEVKATYPVKAKGVSSQAYSYYQPEIKGETLSRDITVN